jgi:heavy metal sensor kinase
LRGFNSLRWRIASFYVLLLVAVLAAVALALGIELRHILLDQARTKVDRIGTDIGAVVRGAGAENAFGTISPIEEELTLPGNLDRWSSPTTFVELDSAEGVPEGKSSNLGGAAFEESPVPRPAAVVYSTQTLPVGTLYVRDELIRTPGASLIVKVGESLDLYDETLDRVRALLIGVALLGVVAVIAGSFAIAASAVEPIDRLSDAMREIRSDQLDRRLGRSTRTDELGRLADNFDAMLDRLEEGFARERQFISDASHELKTPLTVISANAQMLERWADRDAEVRGESLRAIRDESEALARIVNGMLLLAKAESGDGIPREPVALDAVLGEAVKFARPRAEAKGLALELHSSEPPGTPQVLGDASLLRQLFTNLIDNAIKFTETGRIDVALSQAGERAIVEVSDTGPGIDEDVLERVFDRFYRADKSRNRQVEGTGLGLAIVRSIARIHEGTVAAERNPGGGTLFRVSLPTLTALS